MRDPQSLLAQARDAEAEAVDLVRRAESVIARRRGRRAEPRIVDPATHPRRYVSVRVAADWLEEEEKQVRKYLDSGLLPYAWKGQRRKILVAELVAFDQRQQVRKPNVSRETGNAHQLG